MRILIVAAFIYFMLYFLTFAQNSEWIENFQNIDYIYDMVSDTDNNCYITGIYRKDIEFNNEIKLNNSGQTDSFIAKFNELGECQWATSIIGEENDYITAITIDNNGSLYIAGFLILK